MFKNQKQLENLLVFSFLIRPNLVFLLMSNDRAGQRKVHVVIKIKWVHISTELISDIQFMLITCPVRTAEGLERGCFQEKAERLSVEEPRGTLPSVSLARPPVWPSALSGKMIHGSQLTGALRNFRVRTPFGGCIDASST